MVLNVLLHVYMNLLLKSFPIRFHLFLPSNGQASRHEPDTCDAACTKDCGAVRRAQGAACAMGCGAARRALGTARDRDTSGSLANPGEIPRGRRWRDRVLYGGPGFHAPPGGRRLGTVPRGAPSPLPPLLSPLRGCTGCLLSQRASCAARAGASPSSLSSISPLLPLSPHTRPPCAARGGLPTASAGGRRGRAGGTGVPSPILPSIPPLPGAPRHVPPPRRSRAPGTRRAVPSSASC